MDSKRGGRATALFMAMSLGCGFSNPGSFDEKAPVDGPKSPLGVFRVHGSVVDEKTGQSQPTHGFVSIRLRDGGWVSGYELETSFEREDGALAAELVGTGAGSLHGNPLHGTASTQLVMATIPGVSPKFALIPRSVGPRVAARTTLWMGDDGSIALEFASSEDAEHPSPLVFLTGHRVEDPPGTGLIPRLAVSGQPALH